MKTVTIAGFGDCVFFKKACASAKAVAASDDTFSFEACNKGNSENYKAWLEETRQSHFYSFGEAASWHSTSPHVVADGAFVGGCDAFMVRLESEHPGIDIRAAAKAAALDTDGGGGDKGPSDGKGPSNGGKGPAGKGGGKGPAGDKGAKGGGKGLNYAEKQALAAEKLMDDLSGPEGFAGKPDAELTEQERCVLREKGTDQPPGGPYAGDKFKPSKGHFRCKGCGMVAYLPVSKFVH